MPTQTTDLFLLEDLEDADRTSELAEGDLDGLRSVADWIKTYVVKPHEDLVGHAGPVCPFLPVSVERKTLWLASEHIADRDVPDVVGRLDANRATPVSRQGPRTIAVRPSSRPPSPRSTQAGRTSTGGAG